MPVKDNIYVPFVLNESSWVLGAVSLALRQDGILAQFKYMDSDDAYYNLLSKLWKKQETFVIVEHDIIVWPGAITELLACPEPWCTLPYYCSLGWIEDGLGCTKFSDKFLESHKNIIEEPFPTCCKHSTYWCGLDRLIAHKTAELGLKPHIHAPGVINLNSRWT